MLLGDPRVGKSSIVNAFLQKGGQEEIDSEGRRQNMVELTCPNGEVKKIIFHEIETIDLADGIKNLILDQKYDAFCICFEHINYLKKFVQEQALILQYPVPKMALLCKSDLRQFDRKSAEGKEFTEFGLRIFAECSAKTGEFSNFTSNLQKIIENP